MELNLVKSRQIIRPRLYFTEKDDPAYALLLNLSDAKRRALIQGLTNAFALVVVSSTEGNHTAEGLFARLSSALGSKRVTGTDSSGVTGSSSSPRLDSLDVSLENFFQPSNEELNANPEHVK